MLDSRVKQKSCPSWLASSFTGVLCVVCLYRLTVSAVTGNHLSKRSGLLACTEVYSDFRDAHDICSDLLNPLDHHRSPVVGVLPCREVPDIHRSNSDFIIPKLSILGAIPEMHLQLVPRLCGSIVVGYYGSISVVVVGLIIRVVVVVIVGNHWCDDSVIRVVVRVVGLLVGIVRSRVASGYSCPLIGTSACPSKLTCPLLLVWSVRRSQS